MIYGYWTALTTILLVILLITGWGRWIDERLRLIILIPSVLIIWSTAFIRWNIAVTIGDGILSIELSFIAICMLILLYVLTSQGDLDIQLLGLYTATVSISIVMVRAFTMYAPWAGASLSYWHLPFISGLMLGLLNTRFSKLVLIVISSWSFAEVVLIWQQSGEYNGHIGSLQWWDNVAISISGIVILRLIYLIFQKFALQITQLIGNRMKS